MKISKLFYITFRLLLNFFGFGQGNCLYYPTCSEIIVNSIENKGLLSSFRTILKRIYICNPVYVKFGKNWQY
jgi:putative component of membrane protein insertase Oxa1/YidC/SpoIIIJ protein YidD